MAARSKAARKVKQRSDFDISALVHRLRTQRVNVGAWSWTLGEIQQARDAQMRGDFRRSASLADAFATNAAMFVARRNRLAMQRSIPVKMKPANQTARALRWCEESESLYGSDGCGVTPETMVSINKHLADHGNAFGVNTANVRADGSRIDLEHHVWPIAEVRVDPYYRRPIYDEADRVVGYEAPCSAYLTRVDSDYLNEAGLPLERGPNNVWQMPAVGAMTPALPTSATGEVEMVHGDGRWTVYAGEELEPWKSGCVLPGALVWASNAFGFRDMNKGSASHGNVRVMGMLPEGVAIDSPEGAAYLDAILALLEGSSPAGIQPFGAKTEFMASASGAYQIFSELIKMTDASASRIYNGHDGLLGTNSTGPGVDLETLTKISNGVAEGDLHTIERCFHTGVSEVHTALNLGDSTLAPSRCYEIPDTDQNLRREALHKNRMAFYETIKTERALNFDVTAERILTLATDYGVTAAEIKPAASATTTPGATPALPEAKPQNGAAANGAAPRLPASNGAASPAPALPEA